jgi:hypothetical protein
LRVSILCLGRVIVRSLGFRAGQGSGFGFMFRASHCLEFIAKGSGFGFMFRASHCLEFIAKGSGFGFMFRASHCLEFIAKGSGFGFMFRASHCLEFIAKGSGWVRESGFGLIVKGLEFRVGQDSGCLGLILTVCNSDCDNLGFQLMFKISVLCRTYSMWDIGEGISTVRSYML